MDKGIKLRHLSLDLICAVLLIVFDQYTKNLAVIKLKPKEEITNYDATVINTILDQLETIQQSYGKYITLNYHSRKEN